MGGIEQRLTPSRHDNPLEPSRPTGRAEAACDRLRRHLHSGTIQLFEDPDRDHRIAHLMGAFQRELDLAVVVPRSLQRDPLRPVRCRSHPTSRRPIGGPDEPGAALGRDALDDRSGARVELADNDRNARLDDACLFECDLRQGRPQVQLMIERNRRDGGHCGRHDVGCIESPSQPHLAHRDVYLSSTKELECDGGRGFKERRGRIQNAPSEQPVNGFPKRADRRHQVCLFDAASLDDESFGQIHQVR